MIKTILVIFITTLYLNGANFTFTKAKNMIHTINYTNGKYVGQLNSDKDAHGQGTMYWKSGTKYIGKWKNGKYHGRGTLYTNDGDEIDGPWRYGQPAICAEIEAKIDSYSDEIEEIALYRDGLKSDIYNAKQNYKTSYTKIARMFAWDRLQTANGYYDDHIDEYNSVVKKHRKATRRYKRKCVW